MPGSPLAPVGVYELDWENPADRNIPPNTSTPTAPPGWSHREYALVSQVRLARSPEPVRCGCCSVRFELRRNDPPPPTGETRAEVSAAERTTAPNFEPIGAERLYGFSIYLAAWEVDPSPEIVTQWHQHHRLVGSPPLAIQTRCGRWEIAQHWENYRSIRPLDPYDTGQWTDWLVHVRWSANNDGFLSIWNDGQLVFDEQNKKNTYAGYGNYIKIGIYKWDWPPGPPQTESLTQQRVMPHDELRIAEENGHYAAVEPRCYEPSWWERWCLTIGWFPWLCPTRSRSVPEWWRRDCRGWRV
jgi:hypothetical protein